MRSKIKWLGLLTTIGMFFVLLGGALVTKTDSGQGCGNEWTIWLCNGQFIPAYTLESLIEHSHRAVSGTVGLLVLLSFIAVLVYARKRKDLVLYASVSLFFTILQAILGAMAVVLGQISLVMALHFGFSLLAFAATILLAIHLWRLDTHSPAANGWGESQAGGKLPITKSFRNYVWFVTVFCYVVVYFGAYVRHTDSATGCLGWPLCNGQFIPELSGVVGIAFLHRFVALLFFIAIIRLFIMGVRRYADFNEMRTSVYTVMISTVFLILSGGLIVGTLTSYNLHVFSGMLHTMITSVLFGALCYMSILVWQHKKS